MKFDKHFLAILITTSGVLLMSFESLLIKLSTINASLYTFYLGILIFLSTNIILGLRKKKHIIKTYKDDLKIILMCGLLTGISNLSFVSAVKETSVANVVMILASTPLFAAFYSYILYKQKSTKNIFVASFFIFIGLFIIFYDQLGKGEFLGNFYAFITVNMFSLVYVIISKHKNANRFALTALGGLSVSLFSFMLIDNFSIDTNNLTLLLIAGLFVSPISRVLIGTGVKDLPASEVGLLTIIETVMAPIWVWFVLKEIPPNATFVGGSLILITLILNSLYIMKSSKAL